MAQLPVVAHIALAVFSAPSTSSRDTRVYFRGYKDVHLEILQHLQQDVMTVHNIQMVVVIQSLTAV